MKKKIHLSLHAVKYHCISCQTEYQTFSTLKINEKREMCANCCPAYSKKKAQK
jgi:ribosomal protein L31